MHTQTEVNKYLQYYQHRQRGGSEVAVYRGLRRWDQQGGAGPDALGTFKAFAPMLAQGLSSFLVNTASGWSKGKSIGSAAKSAIIPALASAAKSFTQGGQGRATKSRKRRRIEATGAGVGFKREVAHKRKHKRPAGEYKGTSRKQLGHGRSTARKGKGGRTKSKKTTAAKANHFSNF
jgi:hypothetical protein